MTPQIDHLWKTSPVLRAQTPIYAVSRKIDGKTFIFRVNLGMWPLKSMSWKNEPCSEGSNTQLCSFQEDRWENVHFLSKPRHVTPQINHLWKMSPVLRDSTHINGVSRKIDGKTFILRVNLGMWPHKSIICEKQALFWGFQHLFMGVSGKIDGKMFIFRVSLGMWPLKSIVLEKWALFWGFQYPVM